MGDLENINSPTRVDTVIVKHLSDLMLASLSSKITIGHLRYSG